MRFFPTGNSLFAIFDANTQFPGFFMLLQNFNFFSFAGGLGFNLFGTATYYLLSPLNLLILFFNNLNFHVFYTLIIYLKIGLAGLSMFIFLKSEAKDNNFWHLLLSTAYALCGFMSTYYYNTIWMDHLYLLPLLLLGIKKLVQTNQSYLYIIMLTLSLIINFYIGYMLCIFAVIYFIYLNLSLKDINHRQAIKKFIISSLLSATIAAIILLPAFFALMQGKALWANYTDVIGFTNFFELNANARFFFYNLTPGSFQFNDHTFGPALVYSSLLVLTLVTLFFFNPQFSKKEKITVLAIIGFFFLSFLWTGLDYAWQMFQRPIWWQSRYSFTFSAFLIIIASKSILNIKHLKLSLKTRLLTFLVLSVLISISFIFSHLDNHFYQTLSLIFFGLSIFLLFDYFFFIDKPHAKLLILLLLIIELFVNSSSNLRKNDVAVSLEFESRTRAIRAHAVDLVKAHDSSFYRMEFVSNHGSNDGMFFGYNGINYFNSVRNQRIINFMQFYTDISVISHAGIQLDDFNPFLLSLFNLKYLITYELDYWERPIYNYSFSAFENPHPLSVGFMVNEQILTTNLTRNETSQNINNIFGSMINEKLDATTLINGSFIAQNEYLLLPGNSRNIILNGETQQLNPVFTQIFPGDIIETDQMLKLINLTTYEQTMKVLGQNLLTLKASNHLLKGHVNVPDDKTTLFLSIPFDQGLRIRVNGEPVEPIILLDTFIGLNLEPGFHEIIIDYLPHGFITGSIISVIGLTLTTIYLLIERKKRIIAIL